jgi:hypothetical protein
MSFLQGTLFGMPTWLVLLIVGVGGVGIALFLRRRSGSTTTGLGGPTSPAPATDPNIDPNTGVPYAIEEQINPNTGRPNYYDQFPPPYIPPPTPPTTPVDQHIQVDPRPPWWPGGGRIPGPIMPTDPGPGGAQWNPQQMYAAGRGMPPSVYRVQGGASGGAGGSQIVQSQATPWWPLMLDVA